MKRKRETPKTPTKQDQRNVKKTVHRPDHLNALEYLKGAQQGCIKSQFNIGFLYQNGKGDKQDYSKAMEWYLKAAENGHSASQFQIGWLYKHGKGVKQDYSKAMEWYLKAAGNGHSASYHNIGCLYQAWKRS
ncbi:predicted protein [Naegleria gruberi]|uniref:Predicted protein n=1 Tax=Naegleria gruberi TaxID=5762 RepID=D2VMW8_NAEGR|nr:uncharacterized protein NAEGRDRAFT_70287 [Naegleria gruberi]EFC41815.1 predicted protein [Naegleria gruberi]|eukprot:XP_002674559.1 predicted protein [Naegleria gruberi strain NEG-M]